MRQINEHILHLVEETPAVDVHAHQGNQGIWQAPDLWTIFSYHWLATDIRCAGCPGEVFRSREMDPKERMRIAAPYSKWARNTVNHWCFTNIARDLYGFRDTYLDETNWTWLWDAVQERVDDPQWERQVLDQANVEMSCHAYRNAPRLPDRYFPYELGEGYFCPSLQGGQGGCLGRWGEVAQSAVSLRTAIQERLKHVAAEHGIRALHVWAPISWTYTPVEEGQANALVHKACFSAHLQEHERNELASFTADCTAEVCGELGIPIQLFFGTTRYGERAPNVALYRPEWLRALVPMFAKFPATNFDLFISTRDVSHEATVLARNYPNLWVSGAWWQGFTPSTLSEFFRDRLEMLPMNKWNAFYSDGYCVEWVYGKVTLTRNRLALALSELLEEGLIEEGSVGDIAHAVLNGNARSLYLGGQ